MDLAFRRWSSLVGVVALGSLLAAGCGEEEIVSGRGLDRASRASSALTAEEVLATGPTCTPNGAHGKHGAVADCKACHACGGVLQFDPAGPAVAAGKPLPTFDATAKTCSNVACHGVPAGTFTYYFPDGTGEPALNTVAYGGTLTATTPTWYTTGGAGCTGCHGNPPRNGSSGSNAWHSGNHGGQGPSGSYNQCQFCHVHVQSTNGVATGFTAGSCTIDGKTAPCSSFHADGKVEVTARFTSTCFGCH